MTNKNLKKLINESLANDRLYLSKNSKIWTYICWEIVCVVVPEVSDLAGCIVDEVGENPADFDEAERRSDFVDFFLETI